MINHTSCCFVRDETCFISFEKKQQLSYVSLAMHTYTFNKNKTTIDWTPLKVSGNNSNFKQDSLQSRMYFFSI